jgi:2-keto-4-pentenoate hydratase/2-oxohepta-3-ene-1,7-dioic acid hydratase in catechol pathway
VDEIPDPQALPIQTRVNEEVRQNATTADMIFTVAEVVAWISRFLTLQPGDVIATGTPSGVGSSTQTFLQPGDTVEVEVTGLGVLRNTVT